jgi:hypothetical protein
MTINKIIKTIGLALIMAIMALYPIYKNISNGAGLAQYSNHKLWLEGNSNTFDPWQYRILCPLLVEQLYYLMDGSLLNNAYNKFKLLPFAEKAFELRSLQSDPLLFKYTIVFVLFRFVEHLLIYFLLWKYLGLFTKNKILISLFILMASWAIANAVMNSDLSLNTYLDVVFYLLAAYVIVAKKNINWIIPLSIVSALNRESAAFIPLMLFFNHCDFKNKTIPPKKIWLVTTVSFALFFGILTLIRLHYGYRPESRPWNFFKYNLYGSSSFYTYLEMFGATGFLPAICLYYWRKNSPFLQMSFWLIVPIWLFIHFYATFAREARCFLVPIFMIFMPMIVELIEQKYQEFRTTPI